MPPLCRMVAPRPGDMGHLSRSTIIKMARPDGRGWWKAPEWTGKLFGASFDRANEKLENRFKDDPPDMALERAEDHLALTIRVFGSDGGPTSGARSSVARQLEKMDRLPEAQLLRQEVFEANRHHLGYEHPDTLTAELWLAVNLRNQDLPDEAKPHLVHVCALRRQILGPDDEHTILAEKWLASLDD
jgi:hypothetical protein